MLLAYITNGNTVLFNVPLDEEETMYKGNRYDYYAKYYVGTLINSIHTKDVIEKMDIDKFYISVLNRGDYAEIEKEAAYRILSKYAEKYEKHFEKEHKISL